MEINVLNSDLQKIAIIDNYTSLIWSRRYYDIGALDLEIDATNENISIFRKGNYITRNNDDGVYIIKALEIDTKENGDNYLIVGAYEIKELLQRRIIWNTVVFSGTAENYIRKLITDNVINPTSQARRISNFNLKSAKGYTEGIDQQVSYDNLADKIIEVCTTYGYGWKVTLENGRFYFDLYKGVDHTVEQDVNVRLLFSPDNENIISTKYKTDDSNFKNVALVGGEGEGVDRKKRTIGNAEGLERFETFIDASGLSTNTEEGDLVDYYNALIAEGKEKLSEQAVVSSFEGEVDLNQYKYKVDYNLGDIVTVRNEFGIQANARITEVIETWDDEGYTVEPKFEYYEPIDFEIPVEGALLTENRMMLLSESGGTPITTEDATNGIKISELEPVDELFDGCCFPIVQNGATKKVTKATLQSEITKDIEDKTASTFYLQKLDGTTDPQYFKIALLPSINNAGNIDGLMIQGVTDYKNPFCYTIKTRTSYEIQSWLIDNLDLRMYLESDGKVGLYIKYSDTYNKIKGVLLNTKLISVYGGTLQPITPQGTEITNITRINHYLDKYSNSQQTIRNTSATDTPLYLEASSIDNECWQGFRNNAVTKGYFGYSGEKPAVNYGGVTRFIPILFKKQVTYGNVTLPAEGYKELFNIGLDDSYYILSAHIAGWGTNSNKCFNVFPYQQKRAFIVGEGGMTVTSLVIEYIYVKVVDIS